MEVGYNTTDIGAEFQWYKDGKFIGLHLATNAKLHHSFHASDRLLYGRRSYGQISIIIKIMAGWELDLGYRYYTRLRPHGFFIGAKADLFTYKIGLKTQTLILSHILP